MARLDKSAMISVHLVATHFLGVKLDFHVNAQRVWCSRISKVTREQIFANFAKIQFSKISPELIFANFVIIVQIAKINSLIENGLISSTFPLLKWTVTDGRLRARGGGAKKGPPIFIMKSMNNEKMGEIQGQSRLY